jgi:hypothetical protein
MKNPHVESTIDPTYADKYNHPLLHSIRHDKELGYLDISWGEYEYSIALDRIPTPMALLEWIAHIEIKDWPGTTPRRIVALIAIVCRIKGWKLYGNT